MSSDNNTPQNDPSANENAEKHGSIIGGIEIDEAETEAAMRKYDQESRTKNVAGIVAKIVTVIACCMSMFHFYMAGIGHMAAQKQRFIHLAFALALIFLIYPARKSSTKETALEKAISYILSALGFCSCFYFYLNIDTITSRMTLSYLNQQDMIVAIFVVVLTLIAARRAVGNALTVIALTALAYGFAGPYLPGFLHHRGFKFAAVIEHMVIGSEGIFGTPLGTSCTYIFIFILFGAFLGYTGLTELFTNGSLAIAGDKPGGPAKVSIIASGLLGMINGTAAGNVVTTGTFTIPLMKKTGYQPHFAGAVEAVASTGGQIMPPVMGATAFIMAEFLGITYRSIIFFALIPAVMYYVTLWFTVDAEAKRTGLMGMPKDQLPDGKKELRSRGHLLIPVVLLIVLLMQDHTPAFCAFYSLIALFIISSLKKSSRLDFKKVVAALSSGAKQALGVAIACAVVGITVGIITLTGLALQLSNIILNLSGGYLLLTLVLTMIVCIVLGMGLPTSAAYIVAVTVAVPAVTKLGVPVAVAHMFVFYYAALSAITPPVALAAYAGAGIAQADPNKVGWTAVKLGLAGFLVPFMFVYSPALLMMGSAGEVAIAFITAIIGCIAISGAMEGYQITSINILERILLFISALLLIDQGMMTNIIGIVVFAGCIMMQLRRKKLRNVALS